jgi:hypothetical protein
VTPPKARGVNATASAFLHDQDPKATSSRCRQRADAARSAGVKIGVKMPSKARACLNRVNGRPFAEVGQADRSDRRCWHAGVRYRLAPQPAPRKALNGKRRIPAAPMGAGQR